jgi:hypothetical protein
MIHFKNGVETIEPDSPSIVGVGISEPPDIQRLTDGCNFQLFESCRNLRLQVPQLGRLDLSSQNENNAYRI